MPNMKDIIITPEMLNKISELDVFKANWDSGAIKVRPDVLRAMRMVATIESVGSSNRIEGNKMTDAEIETLFKNVNKTSFKSRDEEEVAGYADLVERILNDYSVIPLNENYIKQLHKILLSHSSKDIDHRGEYKTSSNRVAAFDADGHEIGSIFETATPFDTPRLMGELLDWTNLNLKERYLHPIVVIGVFVVHFLSVHPFKDGNGRMSRALTTMLMLQSGYSYMPYASMESIIEASKGMYYRAFERNTTHAQKARMDRNHNAICLDIQNRYPAYHNFWLRNSGRSGTRFRLRLGCIPLFKVKNNKVYLFEFIPLFTIKWR